MSDVNELVDWVTLAQAAKIIEKEIGTRITRQTVYNWAKRGWLRVGTFRPLRTTRRWILACLNEHYRSR